MKYKYTILFVLSLLTVSTHAQDARDNVVVLGAATVDPNRYEDIKRSPYLYEEFVQATVTDKNRLVVGNVLLNYNGYTRMFEFKYDDKIVELDKLFYISFEIVSDKVDPGYQNTMSDTTLFLRAINPNDIGEFYIRVHGGEELSIFKDFQVDIIENKVESVGETIIRRYFAPKFYYWMVRNGEASQFRLNKSGVLEAFENSPQVKKYAKEKKMRLTTEDELRELIRYYESR